MSALERSSPTMVAASYLPTVGPSSVMRAMAIYCVAMLSLAAVLDSYHIVYPLVGCQDVVHSALIRDTLPVMDFGETRDIEHICEPHNRTLHADTHHQLVPIPMEIIESAFRSLADECINHSAGIEGNDSNDWCSFSLKVSTRVLTRESGPDAMNLDNIDNSDDNHTIQPDQVSEHDVQSVRLNHGLTMPLRPFSMSATEQVPAIAASCIIAAGVPEWSSDTCCPRRP
eukprot:3368044-Amphidinium_carterae.1